MHSIVLYLIAPSYLIEVNDGYSIGSYGLFPADYARLLSSRWAQMTGAKDYSIY